MDEQRTGDVRPARPAAQSDEEFAARVQSVKEHAAVRRADEHEQSNRDRWWIAEGDETESQPSPATEHNAAREAGRSGAEEARILGDNVVGMKTTTEGTAGHDGPPPSGDAARTGKPR